MNRRFLAAAAAVVVAVALIGVGVVAGRLTTRTEQDARTVPIQNQAPSAETPHSPLEPQSGATAPPAAPRPAAPAEPIAPPAAVRHDPAPSGRPESPTAGELIGKWNGPFLTYEFFRNGTYTTLLGGSESTSIVDFGDFKYDARQWSTYTYDDGKLTLNTDFLRVSQPVFWQDKPNSIIVGGMLFQRVP